MPQLYLYMRQSYQNSSLRLCRKTKSGKNISIQFHFFILKKMQSDPLPLTQPLSSPPGSTTSQFFTQNPSVHFETPEISENLPNDFSTQELLSPPPVSQVFNLKTVVDVVDEEILAQTQPSQFVKCNCTEKDRIIADMQKVSFSQQKFSTIF